MSSPFVADLLAGRTALVTGGGTGLGRAIAEGLSSAGARVVIAARRREPLEHAAAEITAATGNEVIVDQVDIRQRDTVEALAGRHEVDVLVNNAGGQFPQKARDYSPNGWNSVIDLNLNGTWAMTQVFGNQMLDSERGGSIVQIVAIVGRGLPGIAHSGAARAGVIELSRTLAFEWGPNVRVNCVAPGAFRTEGWETTYDPRVGTMTGVPIPHPGTPEDIANAVVFLSSPAAAFVTGECLYVDGGHILHGTISALPPGGYPERGVE